MAKEQERGSSLDKMSFEAALAELEAIVRQLESGGGDLSASISSYTRGVALKKHCETKLKDAQSLIEKIAISETGEVSTQAFQLSE